MNKATIGIIIGFVLLAVVGIIFYIYKQQESKTAKTKTTSEKSGLSAIDDVGSIIGAFTGGAGG